jgi:predicted aminopeptidase
MLTEDARRSCPLLRMLAVAAILAALQGCGTMYVAQAARGQFGVMNARRPIASVIADAKTPADLRARLEEVSAARDFASRELGLPDNASYRSYADLRRDFVVWNVVATPELSVEPQRWCFPIVGCLAYRGYFGEKRARAFAANLKGKGFDVVVGGVPAYSTLGKFADPVLNTMMGYGDSELASILFHELSHQLVYVAGDSEFNEAFAVTVERAGLARWLKSRGREDQLERFQQSRARQLQYVALFARKRAELARLYAGKIPKDEMRTRKQAIFASLEADMNELAKQYGRSGYLNWIKEGLNNAHLASVATYFDCVPGFERLLEAQGGDMTKFYAAVREIAGKPKKERHAAVCPQPKAGT